MVIWQHDRAKHWTLPSPTWFHTTLSASNGLVLLFDKSIRWINRLPIYLLIYVRHSISSSIYFIEINMLRSIIFLCQKFVVSIERKKMINRHYYWSAWNDYLNLIFNRLNRWCALICHALYLLKIILKCEQNKLCALSIFITTKQILYCLQKSNNKVPFLINRNWVVLHFLLNK